MEHVLSASDDMLLGDEVARLNRTEMKNHLSFIGVDKAHYRRVLELARESDALADANDEISDLREEVEGLTSERNVARNEVEEAKVDAFAIINSALVDLRAGDVENALTALEEGMDKFEA